MALSTITLTQILSELQMNPDFALLTSDQQTALINSAIQIYATSDIATPKDSYRMNNLSDGNIPAGTTTAIQVWTATGTIAGVNVELGATYPTNDYIVFIESGGVGADYTIVDGQNFTLLTSVDATPCKGFTVYIGA